MGVPEFALGLVEGFVEGAGDHVFYADEAGVLGGAVVDETLADVWLGFVSAVRKGACGGQESDEDLPSLRWLQ